eukprot:1158299-Pelagomonas_calceolata.AAC.6
METAEDEPILVHERMTMTQRRCLLSGRPPCQVQTFTSMQKEEDESPRGRRKNRGVSCIFSKHLGSFHITNATTECMHGPHTTITTTECMHGSNHNHYNRMHARLSHHNHYNRMHAQPSHHKHYHGMHARPSHTHTYTHTHTPDMHVRCRAFWSNNM